MKKAYNKRYLIILRAKIMSAPEIAKELKVSRSYVYRVLREVYGDNKEWHEEFEECSCLTVGNYIRMYNIFNTDEELAKHFGVSRSTLYRFKVKHKIDKLAKQYFALFSDDHSEQLSFHNLGAMLMQIEAILSICEPDADELPAIRLLLDAIRRDIELEP